jgi:hypothetical protein
MKHSRSKLYVNTELCAEATHLLQNCIILLRTLYLFLRRAELNPAIENNSHVGTQETYKIATDRRPFEMKVLYQLAVTVPVSSYCTS